MVFSELLSFRVAEPGSPGLEDDEQPGGTAVFDFWYMPGRAVASLITPSSSESTI